MKRIIFSLLKGFGIVIGVILLYVILSLIIPLIPVGAEKTDEPKTIELYILTNGVHTDLVVPVKTKYIDWSSKLPFENTKGF